MIPARQLIDSIRQVAGRQVAGWYKALISRAAAPPTPRACQSAFSRIGMIRLFPLCLLPAAALAQTPDGKGIFLHGNDTGAMPCAACHGSQAQGNAATGAPRLAGLPEAAIVADLKSFAAGEGGTATMQFIAQALSPQEMAAVARYIASLPK